MKDHAALSPSSSDKWMTCTEWLNATRGLKGTTSIYAAEGTEAHAVLEACLRLAMMPHEITQDEQVQDCIAAAIDWVDGYCKENDATYYSEVRLDWGSAVGLEGQFGTSDLVLVGDYSLGIADYKHGSGLAVDPSTSTQLRLYLAGAVMKYGARQQYTLAIIQPRLRGNTDIVKVSTITHAELMAFLEKVKHAAKKNLEGTGERVAGDHCRWCLAAPRCPTLANYALSIAVAEFGPGQGDDAGGSDLGL